MARDARTAFDLCVAGGGTAGTAAAIAAARRGHRVILLEEGNCLGGISTAGGVNEWFAATAGVGDIFARIRDELDRGAMIRDRFFSGELLKIAWQAEAERAGVTIQFHASLCDARTSAQRIHSVSWASCGTLYETNARFFIDATGEGDLAAAAGAPFMLGDPEFGRTLHMSLTFSLVDTGSPVTPYLPEGWPPIQTDHELPGLRALAPLPDGRIYGNMTKVMGHDPTDPASLSKAECEARRQLTRVVHYLQRTRFPNHALSGSGATIGIREGRRIEGDHILRGEEILAAPDGLTFDDGIAVATSQIDFHSLTKPGNDGWRQRVAPYSIPYRCILVKGLENLLTAGKCISGDQVAHSTYRMTPTCCMLGQAAGTAAALAIEQDLADLRGVDLQQLRGELSARGLELDPRKHVAFAPDDPR